MCSAEVLGPISRLESAVEHINTLATLLAGCRDLHVVPADGMANLLGLIQDEATAALRELRAALP